MGTTKLGVPAKLLACFAYLAAFFSGYVAFILLAGYVLIREENDWLRFHVVKAGVLMVCFSILNVLISLVPNLFTWIQDFVGIFTSSFHVKFIFDIQDWLSTTLSILQKLLFLFLAFKAYKCGDFGIAPVDKLVNNLLNKLPAAPAPAVPTPAATPEPAAEKPQENKAQ